MADNIPDHRIKEMQEQFRKLQEENQRLRGTLDAVTRPLSQGQPPQEDPFSAFDDKTAAAMKKAVSHVVEERVGKERELFRTAYNNLWENFDEMQFQVKHPDVKYPEYQDKINAIREERKKAGQFINREEAYKFVAYDEFQKKAKENPPKTTEPLKPEFDPYLQKYVIPEEHAAPQVEQTQEKPQVQAKPGEAARIGPTVTVDGVQTQRQDDTQLPPAGDLRSSAPAAPARAPIGLSIETADEETLKAFESRFGDVPL